MALQNGVRNLELPGDGQLNLSHNTRPSHVVDEVENLSFRILNAQFTLDFTIPKGSELVVETLIRRNDVRYDSALPIDLSQNPMFRLFGAPEKDKRHVVFDSGHIAPKNLVIKRFSIG